MPDKRAINTHIIMILIFAMALALPGTGLAAKPAKKLNLFDRYIKTKYYEHKLFETATKLAAQGPVCEKPRYKLQREKKKILAPITFDKKTPHPVKGIWFETTNVMFCGKAVKIDVTVIANEKAEPDFAAALVD